MDLAPIVLFVYNRLMHTKQTVEALQKNELASESELYIFSDCSKSSKAEKSVQEVREYLKTIQGFKKIIIVEQKENFGLAKSIISGVTKIVNEYGRVIVLEDDLVTSHFFLTFMNNALEKYKDEKKVWHISGWNYPIDFMTDKDMYFYRVMDCWGWATWADKWNYFEKDTDKLMRVFSKQDIKRFDLDGYASLWRQVRLNKSGRINTWAIYWYATILLNNGLCLNPVKSYVRNIGHDGTGVHCAISEYTDNLILNNNNNLKFDSSMEEDINILKQIKIYFKQTNKSIFTRIYNRFKTKLIGSKK